jgi:hypothetical protein
VGSRNGALLQGFKTEIYLSYILGYGLTVFSLYVLNNNSSK